MPTKRSKVRFFFETPLSITGRTELKVFVEKLFKLEGKSLKSLNYIFCTDNKLLKLNRQYLKHDYYTDILTFNLSDNHKEIAADIYISVPRIRENAKSNRVPVKQEIRRVIFHGALHLCGYDDKTPRLSKKIRGREDYYLKRFM